MSDIGSRMPVSRLFRQSIVFKKAYKDTKNLWEHCMIEGEYWLKKQGFKDLKIGDIKTPKFCGHNFSKQKNNFPNLSNLQLPICYKSVIPTFNNN